MNDPIKPTARDAALSVRTNAQSKPRIVGFPTTFELEWLCKHPDHSLVMVAVDEVFVPMIVDADGKGPVILTSET